MVDLTECRSFLSIVRSMRREQVSQGASRQIGLKNRLDGCSPFGIAFLIGMQPVNTKQVAVRLAVGAQNHIGHINEMQPFVGLSMGLDEAIRFTDNGQIFPTGRCGCDRDVIDGGFWQRGVDILDERKVPIEDLLCRLGFGPRDIIGAGEQHHRPGVIGNDNPIRIVGDLMNSRTAETSVDHGQRRHVLLQRIPERDAGTAGKDDHAARRRFDAILFFELGDGPISSVWLVRKRTGYHREDLESFTKPVFDVLPNAHHKSPPISVL